MRSSAGARLTVMRPGGKLSSAAEIPERTRSRASWQARSARPTIAKPGNAVADVRLDVDPPRLETDERMRDRACKHTSTLRAEAVTPSCRVRRR